MIGAVAHLHRYPIKGYTPQRVDQARLAVDAVFPDDRLFAVEDGPSGFDSAAPKWITKTRFTVLAKTARVAAVRTHYDAATGRLRADAPGMAPLEALLTSDAGKQAFALWLTRYLGDDANGALKVVEAPGHRFTDHPLGHVSLINLASVRDLEAKIGRPIDPLRFRGNIHVEGWPAWVENDWAGRDLSLGGARAKVYAPITRCAATEVDPTTAVRDVEVVAALHANYGHLLCGVYLHVTQAGEIKSGDAVELLAD